MKAELCLRVVASALNGCVNAAAATAAIQVVPPCEFSSTAASVRVPARLRVGGRLFPLTPPHPMIFVHARVCGRVKL